MTMVWVLLRFILMAVAGACVGRRRACERIPRREKHHCQKYHRHSGHHFAHSGMKISGISAARRRIPPALRLRCREATAREGHCGGAVGFVLEVVAGGEVESCEGEVVAARDWHGACLPGSAFWKQGRGSPLAREIPDIFRAALFQDQGQPRGKFRNDDVVFFLAVAPVSEGNSFHTLRTGQARMPPVDGQHEGFWFLRRRARGRGIPE